MLTVDDVNSIISKYGNVGFWYCVNLTKIDQSPGVINYDFCKLTILSSPNPQTYAPGNLKILIKNSFWTGAYYITNRTGYSYGFDLEPTDVPEEYEFMYHETTCIWLYLTSNPVDDFKLINLVDMGGFRVLSPLTIPIFKGEYNEKLYIIDYPYLNYITIDGEQVPIERDAQYNQFIRIPPHDCVIGCNARDGEDINLYNIIFREFQHLPSMEVSTLYRGTPQEVMIIVPVTEPDPVLDFEVYYQGKLLKDHMIYLPYDASDYIDLTVKLEEDAYPHSTVKLKARTEVYTAYNQSGVNDAISQGIQTLQVGDNGTKVQLNSIELSNVTLINSNIQLTDCTLTDCKIIDSTYTDNGGNTITDTIIRNTEYNNTNKSLYTDTTFTECTIHDSELHMTGTIENSTITDTLIISDGLITLTNNTFNGVGAKEYFPSHLYLTGEYTVTGNTFTLIGEWEELEFNICIIKATNDFNQSKFISDNTFNLNITYETEPTNTLYYNIVDEDKIRAVRLQ